MAKASKKGSKKAAPVVTATEEIDILDIASPEDLDAALADVAGDESRAAAYDEQDAPVERTGKASPKAGKKGSTAGSKRTPGMSLDTHKASEIILSKLNLDDPETHFVINNGDTPTTANMDLVLEHIDTLGKKPREKCINAIVSIANGRRPSLYITQAVEMLRKTDMTQNELRQAFEGVGYKPGTARSQAGQLFQVLPALGMAARGTSRGSHLTLNKNSAMVSKMTAAFPVAR